MAAFGPRVAAAAVVVFVELLSVYSDIVLFSSVVFRVYFDSAWSPARDRSVPNRGEGLQSESAHLGTREIDSLVANLLTRNGSPLERQRFAIR